MRLPIQFAHRVLAIAMASVVLAPHITGAQTASARVAHDDRWQPWLGCWRPDVAPPMVSAGESVSPPATSMVCVVPGRTSTAVEIVSFAAGKVVDRTVIDPAQPIARSLDECTGSESATWSADGRRVLLKGLYQCGRGVTRTETGVMAIDADGQWVQARTIDVNRNVTTLVAHYRDTGIALEGIEGDALVERPLLDASGTRMSPPRDGCTGSETATPADAGRVRIQSDYTCAGLHRIAHAEFVRGASGAWERVDGPHVAFGTPSVRAAAGAPVTLDDVLEVGRVSNPALTQAWLADLGQSFALSGKQLVRLADGGVPPSVIDLMVAMSNPRTFQVRRTDGSATVLANEPRNANYGALSSRECVGIRSSCYGVMGLPWMYGVDRFYGWDPYLYTYGAMYSPYNYGRYGYGYSGWNGRYFGGAPVTLIVQPASPPRPSGRAVFGQGYSRTGGSSPSGSDRSIGAGSMSPSSSSRSPSGSGSGSSTGGAASGGARTAKPRGGGL